jgi:hypothetical protein
MVWVLKVIVPDIARVLAISGAFVALVALLRRNGFSPGALLALFWLGVVSWYALKGSFASSDPTFALFFAAALSMWYALKYTGVFPAHGVREFNALGMRARFGERLAARIELATKRNEERIEDEIRYVKGLGKDDHPDDKP